MTIFNGYELVQVRVIGWSKFGVQKQASLDQLITIKICARNFLIFKNGLKTLFYSVFLTNNVLKNASLGQLITIKNPKLVSSRG